MFILADISTAGPVSIPQPAHPTRSTKAKGSRSKSAKSGSSSSRSSTATKSHNNSNYIPTFPKELQKLDTSSSISPTVSQHNQQPIKDSFALSTSAFDPLEALLTSPTKLHGPMDSANISPPNVIGKDKLFQPFSTGDNIHALPTTFIPSFTAENLISPAKTGTSKTSDYDVLQTPQKLFMGSTENLMSLVSTSASTSSSEVRHFALSQDSGPMPVDSQVYKLQDEKGGLKSSFYPGVIDHVSPKVPLLPRKKEVDVPAVPLSTLDHSRSSSPDSKSRSSDYLPAGITSPNISPALPSGMMDTDLAALPSAPASSKPGAAAPSIDIAVNPLGTGYFNALTSKLINPTFSMVADYKTSTPGFSGADDNAKSKTFYENGILINQDYDKISDTNDEDDLERLIEDIDTKHDNIDNKGGMSEIEELLNEFNDKHPDDLKSKTQVDDFLSDVLGEHIKPQVVPDNQLKSEDVFHPPDPIELNQIAISELLEKEMEIIDMETKEVEKSRLNAVTGISISSPSPPTISPVTTTATSTSSVSTTPSTSIITTPVVSISEPKPAPDLQHKAKSLEEPTDFEIPRVGKLMKIRKYVEIQKRKEQTAEKDVEIKVHEKKEPPVEEKPQTILVQVSKRKKIEYGPYINIQTLLEGKPKAMENTSPQKTFKPKPKPQVPPARRTFNLRERKRTDFASLAGTATRAGETKKVDEKAKPEKEVIVNKDGVVNKDEDVCENKQKIDEKVADENNEEESKIITRNKEKAKKEMEKSVLHVDKKKVATNKVKGDIEEKDPHSAGEENGKPKLRTRSAKTEIETTESKNLRKRQVKASAETGKAKVKKVDAVGTCSDTEEKLTRSKMKPTNKTSPDKNEIKKCSVNLGEKFSETKLRIKKPEKEKDESKILSGIESEKKETEKVVNDNVESVVKTDDLESGKDHSSMEETGNIFEKIEQEGDIFDTDKLISEIKAKEAAARIIELEKIECEKIKEEKNKKEKIKEEKIKEIAEVKQFDTRVEKKTYSDSTVISITTGANKKVTMKLKLGPEFARSSPEFVSAPKKRKFDIPFDNQTETREESKEAKREERDMEVSEKSKEQIEIDMKKGSVENEFQRLVDEAMAEVKNAQKEGESGKKEKFVNLRRRLNDNIKYNLDDSEDDIEKVPAIVIDNPAKVQKPVKGLPKVGPKGPVVPLNAEAITTKLSKKSSEGSKHSRKDHDANKQPKKDMDVYDFTDTEMSDHEEASPMKVGFKPKYVSNLTKGPSTSGQNKPPFVSIPLSPEGNMSEKDLSVVEEEESNSNEKSQPEEEMEEAVSYVGKTVEPLKIKLSKINFKPFKEKRHKHKKKKKKRDRSRERESRYIEPEEMPVDVPEVIENIEKSIETNTDISANNTESPKQKLDDIRSVESVGNETTSNEGDDDTAEGAGKQGKKSKLKEKKHICEYCNLGFSQKCDLRRHIMIHTGERPWPCEICDKKFQRKTDLAKHMRTHTGEKPYACEFCDKRVSDKSQLNVHRRLHTGDRPYQCTKCGKKCITSSELSRHRLIHCSDKLHQCEFCKKTFTEKECLGMHMKLHYRSRSRPFKCDKCTIGFDKKTALDIHKCVDPTSNVYMCSECYEEFSDEMLYADHIKTHDLGVLACNVCTKLFNDKHRLETHVCSLGEDKLRQITCEICDMDFPDHGKIYNYKCANNKDSICLVRTGHLS